MFTIKKKVRRLLIFCFAGLAVAAVGFVLKDFIFPRYEKVTDQVLEVQTEADISYSVHLKDNPIFGQSMLPEDGYYLKPFIDYVDVTCNLSVSADKAADIEATTTVDVSLVSQLGSDDDAEVIWEKTQTYAPAETSISADGQMSLDRIVKLDFAQYDALINELIDEYDLVTDYYIKVLFSAVVSAGYDGEMVEKPLVSELIIPFNNQIFSIDGDRSKETTLAIEHETERKLGFDLNQAILCAAVFAACGIIALLLILKTKSLPNQDTYAIEVAQIFKKYGNRLAGLSEALAYQSSIMISIDKIEDMVKIADEVGQTIFYFQVEDDTERKIEFYVFDESRVFYLAMFGEL